MRPRQITLCLVAIMLALGGCARSGDYNGGPKAPPKELIPYSDLKPPVAKEPEPISEVGAKTQYTHHLWTMKHETGEVQIESLAWCEVSHVAEEFLPRPALNYSGPNLRDNTYCIYHEVAKLSQGGRVAYINRIFDSLGAGSKRLLSNLNPKKPEQMWSMKDDEWVATSELRAKYAVQRFEQEVPLAGYKPYYEKQHELYTDRCRKMPGWEKVRALTPVKQGNLPLYSVSMFAMNKIANRQLTAIEVDPLLNKVVFVSTMGTEEYNQYLTSFTRDYEEPEKFLWELSLFRVGVGIEILQALRPRNNIAVQVWSKSCSESYNDFVHNMIWSDSVCRLEWSTYLPKYSLEIENQIVPEKFEQRLSDLARDLSRRWLRLHEVLWKSRPPWELLPVNSPYTEVPEKCFKTKPVFRTRIIDTRQVPQESHGQEDKK